MQKSTNQTQSVGQKILKRYYKKLILLNKQYQCSIYYTIMIQILRFVFGHSQIYCIFMIKFTSEQQENNLIFNKLSSLLQKQALQNYFYFELLLIVISVISAITFLLFWMGQKFQKNYNIMKIIYYLSHIIEVSNEFLFSIFAIVLYASFKRKQFLSLLVIVPGMAINVFFFKMTVIFQQKNSFQSSDIYSHNQNYSTYIINMLFCGITFVGTLFQLSEFNVFFLYVIILCWIILQIFRIRNTVLTQFYDKIFTNYCYYLVVCTQTVQILVFTLYDLTRLSLIQTNIIVLVVLITVFLYWSALNYSSFRREESYFWSVDELTDSQDFYQLFNSYFIVLQRIKSNSTSEDCLIVSSIKKNHQIYCINNKCYCHANRQHSQLYYFMKNFILDQMKKTQVLHQNNRQIMIYLLSFKFYIYRFYSNIHQQIQKFRSSYQLNIFEEFLIDSIRYKVKSWVEAQNHNVQSLRTDVVLDFEDQMQRLNDIILEDVTCKFKKWNVLTRKLCKVQELTQFSQKELQNIKLVQLIKKNRWLTFNKSLAFNSIIYFYFKKVVLKMNDLNLYEQNIIDLGRKIKEEQLCKSDVFVRNLFHQNSCTFQSQVNQNNVGNIIQVSKSVLNVFGYVQDKIIGKNVSCLIPKFLSNEHSQTMKSWIQKGGNFASQKITEVYCLHQQGSVFTAFKYFKIHPTLNGVNLITTFFKRNQNDLILIDDNNRLQTYGNNLKSILNHISSDIQIDYVFKNMKRKIQNASFKQEKQAKTIIYNKEITHVLINRKKEGFNEQCHTGTTQSLVNYIPEKTLHYDDIWKMSFKYKKMKIMKTSFFVIQVKTLEYIQVCDEDKSKNVQDNAGEISQEDKNMNFQTGRFDMQQMKRLQMKQRQQNSSMASYNTQLGYGISKMITRFSEILLQPKLLNDKRSSTKIILDMAFFLSFITIVTTTLLLNRTTLQDKITVSKTKAKIDRTFHLLQVTTNHVYNIYMYRKDLDLQKLAVAQTIWDSEGFIAQITTHFKQYNEDVSMLKTQPLYKYLTTPLKWSFPEGQSTQIELLEFFKLTFYVATTIKNELSLKFQNKAGNFTLTTQMFTLLGLNVPALRTMRQSLNTMTIQQLQQDAVLNTQILIISSALFFAFSLTYSLIANNDRKFRFHQLEKQTKIYCMISVEMMQNLKDYYFTYYHHFVNEKIRIDCRFINNQPLQFERQLDQPSQSQSTQYNKVKLLGQGRYSLWIAVMVLFLALNAGSLLIALNMFEFNTDVQFFSKITNKISDSQSILLNRLVRLKAKYYFDKRNLNQRFLDQMLSKIQVEQVMFNSYVTFDPNWITLGDSSFRSQFNSYLLQSPCQLNKQILTAYQLKVCRNYTVLSQNGIITFVNGFSRLMRNTYLQWKNNLEDILRDPDYLGAKTQFKEVDFALTFHVQTFNKLSNKIISAYENGFFGQYRFCVTVLGVLLIAWLIILLWNIKNYMQDRKALAMLYGYVLLVPPISLKNSKYLIKFLQTNLEFQEKY